MPTGGVMSQRALLKRQMLCGNSTTGANFCPFVALDNLPYRLCPLHADQFLIQSAIEVTEPVGIEAHLVEHRRVKG